MNDCMHNPTGNPPGRLLVLGLGESGEAAACLGVSRGWEVAVLDAGESGAIRTRAQRLRRRGVEVLCGVQSLPDLPADRAVISPGIPLDSAWPRELSRRGIPVVAELEFGWRSIEGPVLAVTGSNGKTTACVYAEQVLRAMGRSVVRAGNSAPPLCAVADSIGRDTWVVLEVSSFQLEAVEEFRPDIGVLLNIQPNHLDRHGDMRTYAAAKARLFARMGPGARAVVPRGDLSSIREWAGQPEGVEWWTFGDPDTADAGCRDGVILRGERVWADLRTTAWDHPVWGIHAAALGLALEAAGAVPADLEAAARGFSPPPHRFQELGSANGIRWIDDSKSTSLAATAAAVRAVGGGVRLIAGGRSKESDVRGVLPILQECVAAAYLIGEAADTLAAAWGETVPCVRSGTLEEAVRRAAREARPGETLLLSPGCTSFDQFAGYEERGEAFARMAGPALQSGPRREPGRAPARPAADENAAPGNNSEDPSTSNHATHLPQRRHHGTT